MALDNAAQEQGPDDDPRPGPHGPDPALSNCRLVEVGRCHRTHLSERCRPPPLSAGVQPGRVVPAGRVEQAAEDAPGRLHRLRLVEQLASHAQVRPAVGVGVPGIGVEVDVGAAAVGDRRQAAAYAGLVPTPWKSGRIDHEQGISKAGNPRLRRTMIELAWQWLRARRSSARLEVTGSSGHGLNLAVPSWLLRRDDQIGGAVFWPIEHLERRGFPGMVRQPSVRVADGRLTADRSGTR